MSEKKGSSSSGSHNPLKKLRKRLNKLKGADKISRSEEELARPIPLPADKPFSNTLHSSLPRKRLIQQGSFQSTGTATSLTCDSPASGSQTESCESSDLESFQDSRTELFHTPAEVPVSPSAAGEGDGNRSNDVAELDPSEKLTLEVTANGKSRMESKSESMKLEVTVLSGSGLAAMDSNGFSDPYVKIKYQRKTVFKTRIVAKCLNPSWNESVTISVKDVNEPIVFRIFDHDTFKGDDFMGSAMIDISQFSSDRPVDMSLNLESGTSTDESLNLGQLHIRVVLHADAVDSVVRPHIGQVEQKSMHSYSSGLQSLLNMIKQDSVGSVSEWDYIVRIVLVEGYDLLSMDSNGVSDPYVRFVLQGEKYKSKIRNKTLNPKWFEEFSMHLYDQKSWLLDLNVFDYNIAGRADFMGRAQIDLKNLSIDHTHDLKINLEDEAGTLRLLVTITGAVSSTDHEAQTSQRENIVRRYGLLNSFQRFSDVGWLQLKVIRAHGLTSKDWGGKSDPFCTVELANTMLQSHTSYKTLNPEWNRCFTVPVKDIHSVLVITVYDEDKDMKKEFLGRISLPLVMVENRVQKWYGLKDAKCSDRAKGAILLELDLIFNHFKAAIRTFNPREERIIQEEPKFKISTFKRNVRRVKVIVDSLVSAKNFWQSLIDWEIPSKTIPAFIAFMIMVWNFQLYMAPLVLIFLFMWNLIVKEIKGTSSVDMVMVSNRRKKGRENDTTEEDLEEPEGDGDTKRSFKEYYEAVKSIGCTVQNVLGTMSDYVESIKNSFNWTTPWLSALAVIALSIIMVILFFIPFRYIVLLWGVNKFTKKLRKPNYIPNNEILDFLSRVPSDIEKDMYREYRPDIAVLESPDGKLTPNMIRKRK